MTSNKELSKQQRPWLQIYNKIHSVYGRQALNSKRKIFPNSIIYLVWWKCHRDSPQEKKNAAGPWIRHLPDSVLGLQHPLKPQDGNTHPHFPTSQELQQPQKLQKDWDTLPTYFPAYPEGCNVSMVQWISIKQLIGQNSERWQPDPSSSVSKRSKSVMAHCWNQEKMVQHFAFYPLLTTGYFFFFLAKHNSKQF